MPILKITDGDECWYMVWSTVSDAPLTYGMSLDELRNYCRNEYGRADAERLERVLPLVEANGCDAENRTADDYLYCNRAGDRDQKLTRKQIIDYYCRRVARSRRAPGKAAPG